MLPVAGIHARVSTHGGSGCLYEGVVDCQRNIISNCVVVTCVRNCLSCRLRIVVTSKLDTQNISGVRVPAAQVFAQWLQSEVQRRVALPAAAGAHARRSSRSWLLAGLIRRSIDGAGATEDRGAQAQGDQSPKGDHLEVISGRNRNADVRVAHRTPQSLALCSASVERVLRPSHGPLTPHELAASHRQQDSGPRLSARSRSMMALSLHARQ